MALYSLLALSSIPILLYLYISIPFHTEPPEIDKDAYFGCGDMAKDDSSISPFPIQFADQVKEMHKSSAEAIDFFNEGTFERRITSFLAEFNWEQHSQFINSFSHYKTEIEGLSIQFVHKSIKHESTMKVFPILLLPSSFSSFWSFFKIIPILSNPVRHGFDFGLRDRISFNVIIPSYHISPCHGNVNYLDKTAISRIFHKLMTNRLSYSQYFIYGDGGIGSEIASTMSTVFPSEVKGLIVRDPVMSTKGLRRLLQLYLLPSDDIETKTAIPVSIPPLLDHSFTTSLKYLIQRWNDSEEKVDLDKTVTLDEISTSFSLFILPRSLQSHIDLLSTSVPDSILEATTSVPSFVISSHNNVFHVPQSLLRHKFVNLSRYEEITGGMTYSLSNYTDIAKKIFSFVELC